MIERKPWNSVDGLNIIKQGGLTKDFKKTLLESRQEKSFWNNDELANIVNILSSKDTRWRSKIQESTDPIFHHQIKILGMGKIPFSEPFDWHNDPVTSSRYPMAVFDILQSLWNEKSRNFDPKFRAEVNRMQFLVPLGIAYVVMKDEKYAEKAKILINHWIDSNPPVEHLYWRSALEISIRLISWIFCMELCIQSNSWDGKFIEKFWFSIHRQTRYIELHLQNREYLNNHIIGEAAVLAIIGMHFPEFPDSSQWVSKGMGILQDQINNQTFRDGVSKEKSTHYHRFVVDFLTMVLVFCNKYNQSLNPEYLERLEKMYEFLFVICRPDGTMPLIGDEDGGRVIRFTETPNDNILSLLSTGAVIFKRGDMKYVSGAFHEDSLWLLGIDGHQRFESLSSEKPDYLKSRFSDGGVYVIRDKDITLHDEQVNPIIKSGKNHLVFLCGSQGMGHAGHSHADALSICLYSNGIECLVDPGTYKYNFDPHWRNYFRGTSAHNTLCIDHQDQSTSLSVDEPFGWKEKVDAKTNHVIYSHNYDFLEGYHEGYKKLNDTVVHQRSVMSIKTRDQEKIPDFTFPNYFIVTDYITGNKTHDIQLNYHLSPCQIYQHEMDGGDTIQKTIAKSTSIPVAFNKQLFIFTFPNHTYMVIVLLWQKGIISKNDAEHPNDRKENGPTNIVEGWISKEYGVKIPAPVLNLRLNNHPCPALFHTILLPGLSKMEYQSIISNLPFFNIRLDKSDKASVNPGAIESTIQIQWKNIHHLYYWSSDKNKTSRKIDSHNIEMDGSIAHVQLINGLSIGRGLFLNCSSVIYNQQKIYPQHKQDYIELDNIKS